MLKSLMSWIGEREHRLRHSFGKDIKTRRGRFWAHVHYHLVDHAFLRLPWTNFFEIAPGVYRSNHPGPRRLKRYHDMGITSVLTLRGKERYAHYLFEEETCRKLGMKLYITKLWARNATNRDRLVAVLDTIREIEKPFVFHCKSGADRAGIVSAMYLMVFENVPVEEAKKQLGVKYLHLKWTKTGVQDFILDVYEARKNQEPIGFEDWLKTEYRAMRLDVFYERGDTPDQAARQLRELAEVNA